MPTNYKQYDAAWASNPYAGENMKAAGCGPTSCACVTDRNPWTVAQWMTANGYASNGSGTYHGGIPAYIRSVGYSSSMIARGINGSMSHTSFSTFQQSIQQGYCGILLMGGTGSGCRNNYWTSGGHYIAIVGYKNGMYNVFDPASTARDGFHAFSDFAGCIKNVYTTTVPGGITDGNIPASEGASAGTVTGSLMIPAVYSPRISAPENDDLNYINTAKGGKNLCTAIDNKTGSVLPNCVGYCYGRFMEILGSTPKLTTGNANNWYSYVDGYQRGKDPKVGAVGCWVNANGAGHLAVVEKIYTEGANKGSVLFSTSIYPNNKFVLQIGKAPNYLDWKDYVFKGFIYNPMAASDEAQGGDLYDETNDEDDAVLREVGYISGHTPTAAKTSIRLSCINYTTALGAFFKGAILEPGMIVSTGVAGGSVDLSGVDISSQDSVAKAVFQFFLSKGLNAAACCGILGNMMQESSMNPAAYAENPNNTYPMRACGLVQWTDGGRYNIHNATRMISYVGQNWRNNLSGQLEYLHKQLTENFQSDGVNFRGRVWEPLLAVPNNLSGAYQARYIFQEGFEGYSGEAAERNTFTKMYWDKLAIQI